jgi:hypothetical protein
MGFSRNSIVESLILFEGWTTNEFERFLYRFSLEKVAPSSFGSKPTRINALIEYLIENPNLSGPGGAGLELEIIEHILTTRVKQSWGPSSSTPITDQVPELSHSLQRDGYSITIDGKLQTVLPQLVPLAPKQSELEVLLDKHSFTIPLGHLQQALSAHTRGDWAAANSQLRPFIESLFDCVAGKLLTPPLPSNSYLRREALSKLKPPFIDPALNEWDPAGNGFLQGFWRRLHPQGPHPGLSDKDDCTLRLQLVILVGHHFVKRFDTYP